MSDERTVAVWADTLRVGGRCRGPHCGARIFFAQTVARGKTMPFTGDPVPRRTYQDPQTGRRVYELAYDDCHFRSCPDANDFSAHPRRTA